MANPETDLMRRIQLAVSASGVRLLRNNVGNGFVGDFVTVLPNGDVVLRNWRRVQYGLAPGSADLIGWRPLVITPRHVGQRLAQFLAGEVKRDGQQPTPVQRDFLTAVNNAGGVGAVVRSIDEALAQFVDSS